MPTPFSCTACGQCCKNVHKSEETSYLNRGDGTCQHFDDASLLCTIYADRPLVCRVEDYYHKHLAHQYDWDGFVQMNLEICKTLQQQTNQ